MCQLVPGPPSYVQMLPGSLARTCPSGLHDDSGWELPGKACARSLPGQRVCLGLSLASQPVLRLGLRFPGSSLVTLL